VVSQFTEDSFGDSSAADTKISKMRSMFTRFMKSDPAFVSRAVSDLISRVSSSSSHTKGSSAVAPESTHNAIKDIANVDDLMVRLNGDFPGDIGVMCPLLLNCVELRPGESFFMGPAEPHAYISGDCIECMAPSDNVIRSGLTPKFKDVDVLCDMLTYSTGKLSTAVHPIESDAHNLIYRWFLPVSALYYILSYSTFIPLNN
jgi:mannose-6-phosphate isomerase